VTIETTDFIDVVDFTNMEANTPTNRSLIVEITAPKVTSSYFGNVEKVYTLSNVPGLFFIPCPFSAEQQKYWIKTCLSIYTIGHPSNLEQKEPFPQITDFEALRWVSLGYHYQWTERIYTEEKKGAFPSDLENLVKDLAKVANYDLKPEAAIINYYPTCKCQMGAHVDDAEEDMSKPIVSVSFGNTIVFLIGGRTRTTPPVALFVRSGDIVIMSGESRYCYHSVPRMIEQTVPKSLLTTEDEEWIKWRDYISHARINMNCRQVRVSPEKKA